MTATLVLSFNSFGLAALIGSVALFAVGLAPLALKLVWLPCLALRPSSVPWG